MNVMTFGTQAVTTGRNTVATFTPMSGTLSASGWKAARTTVELFYAPTGSSQAGNFSLRAYYEVSDDGKTWTSATQLGPTLTADGTGTSTGGSDGFLDLTNAVGKRFIRFGVVSNNTILASRNRCGYAALRVERRSY